MTALHFGNVRILNKLMICFAAIIAAARIGGANRLDVDNFDNSVVAA